MKHTKIENEGESVVVSLIVAMGRNREIGKDNRLLWNIKEDLRWFKAHTMHKPVIMGRRTYESIGRPLPGRLNIVLSRDQDYQPHEDVVVRHCMGDIIREFGAESELMVIGGAMVYKQFLPHATKLYLTEIDRECEADTYFPDVDLSGWDRLFHREGIEDTEIKYEFSVYKRMED